MIPPITPAMQRAVVPFLALFPILSGFLSLSLGQDANWDLRNYHWYNAHAFLTGRLGLDVAPGQIATYYNPTLDLPFYLAARDLPARLVGFLLGAVQGLNLLLLFGLTRSLLAPLGKWRDAAALAVGLSGFFGAGQIGLIGTTFYDNVISLFVLGGVWLAAADMTALLDGRPLRAFTRAALAGFLVGCGAGLKQPTVVFAVGSCFAFLLMPTSVRRRLFLSFFFGLGVLAGIALFSGHWMWYLWETYGNPLFPYFNHLFQSPWALPEAHRDDKFVPAGLWEALFFPFRWVADPLQVGEITFRDLRIPTAYAVLLATPFLLPWRRAAGATITAPRIGRYLIATAILSYLAWLKLFSIYRYLIPLEMMAPLVIVAAIGLWPVPARIQGMLIAALLALVTVTAQPGSWGRVAWTGNFVQIQAPPIPDPDRTLILMTGFAPTSFLISGFPPQITFLRVQSYLVHPEQGNTGLNRHMAERIAAHRGDIFVLMAPWDDWTFEDVLPHFGLTAEEEDCRPVLSNLDEPMHLCRARRQG